MTSHSYKELINELIIWDTRKLQKKQDKFPFSWVFRQKRLLFCNNFTRELRRKWRSYRYDFFMYEERKPKPVWNYKSVNFHIGCHLKANLQDASFKVILKNWDSKWQSLLAILLILTTLGLKKRSQQNKETLILWVVVPAAQ